MQVLAAEDSHLLTGQGIQHNMRKVEMMHVLWGILMAVVGLFMLVCGTLKSEFIIYRLMVARSRILWGQGDAVHRFYQVCGLSIIVLGALFTAGLIWTN
ncbi:MAG: hypothetical protein H8E44_11100 [Planctomycetes bacterium]|nr:hypothetical protein [Planctomycetota bacterium]